MRQFPLGDKESLGGLILSQGGGVDDWQPQDLIEKSTWQRDYFDPSDTSARFLRREYFAGN